MGNMKIKHGIFICIKIKNIWTNILIKNPQRHMWQGNDHASDKGSIDRSVQVSLNLQHNIWYFTHLTGWHSDSFTYIDAQSVWILASWLSDNSMDKFSYSVVDDRETPFQQDYMTLRRKLTYILYGTNIR